MSGLHGVQASKHCVNGQQSFLSNTNSFQPAPPVAAPGDVPLSVCAQGAAVVPPLQLGTASMTQLLDPRLPADFAAPEALRCVFSRHCETSCVAVHAQPLALLTTKLACGEAECFCAPLLPNLVCRLCQL